MDIPQIYTVGRKTLYEINNLLHLSNRNKNQDNARQIEDELRTKYKYSGEYDTRYIREFLKVYNLSEENDELNNDIKEIALSNLLDNTTNTYHVDAEKYNQLRNPHYLQEIRQSIVTHNNANNTIDEYIDYRYKTFYEDDIFEADDDKLIELSGIMGLPPSDDRDTVINQIIKELITRYHYFGDYNMDFIDTFIQLYSGAFFDGEEGVKCQIKLDSLVSNDNYFGIEPIEGNKYYMDLQAYQILHDATYLDDVAKLLPEELKRYGYTSDTEDSLTNKETLTIKENNTSNEILPNHKMTQRQIKQLPQYQTKRSAKSKVGMTDLARIVLDMQRDFKRVANALSVQGAQSIVNKHNEQSPNSQWKLEHKDFNGDNIPDIVIMNDKDQPIIVNGWTTKRSDYPARYQYYNKYPTADERKEHPYSTYKHDELYGYQYDDENHNMHLRGNITGYNKNAFPNNWKLGNYNVHTKPRSRLSAYQRFQRYVLKERLDFMIQRLVEANAVPVDDSGNMKDKLKIIAKLTAYLWNKWIIKTVADRYGVGPDDKNFVKFKNKPEGKSEIDSTVTAFYYHMNETNDNWSEQQRAELEEQFMNDIADKLEQIAKHVETLEEHHYARMEGVHNAHNNDDEGEFDEY